MPSLAPWLAKRLPFYYGWVVVISVSVVGFAGVAFLFGVVGVLFIPMSDELGWSRSVIPAGQLTAAFLVLAIAPVVGRLVDKHGPRAVIASGSLVMMACLIGLAWTNSIIMFLVLFGIGASVHTATSQTALAATTAKWFVRRRGLASAVSGVGAPLGFVGLPIVALWAMDTWDWRAAWIAMGALVFVMGVPTSLLLLVRSPEDIGQAIDGDPPSAPDWAGAHPIRRSAAAEVQWTTPQVVRSVSFWMLLAALVTRGLAQGGVQIHLVPHLEDLGFEREVAATAYIIGGAVMAGAGFLWGPLSDRIHVRHVYNLGSALLIAYILATIYATNFGMIILVGVLQGFTIGATIMVQRVAYANFFGRESAGAIQGIAVPFQVLGNSAGGLVAAGLFIVGGSYFLPFWIFIGLVSLGMVMMFFMPDPKKAPKPAEATPSL
jgi:OFA family oxalate/formate antiporter-like MFS transporter